MTARIVKPWPAWLALLALLLIAALSSPTEALAQSGPTDDQVNAIAKQLYCPVCENIPLDVCPTTACAQWRGLIRQMLAEGKGEQEIKDHFVATYGIRVLAEPPRQGFSWLAYLLPPVAFLVGAVMVYRVLRGSREAAGTRQPAPTAGAEPASPADDPYLRRVEEELRQRERESKL